MMLFKRASEKTSPSDQMLWSIRMKRLSQCFLGCALVFLLVMSFLPIGAVSHATSGQQARLSGLSEVTEAKNVKPLLVKMARIEPLIRPAQVQAAVKDTGAAKRLLAKLKLQGVVQMGAGHVAYIQVAGQGVATVKPGGSVLDFVVEKVEPGHVVLSLDGTQVELGH